MKSSKPVIVDESEKTKVSQESIYVHRYSGYLGDLKKNWAYVGQNKIPKGKYDASGK